MSVLRDAWRIARKDLTVESRSRELVLTLLFFSVACLLIFAFAFVRGRATVDNAPAGIIWITVVFAGTLALGRTFERERQGDTLRALLLAPVERPAIYLGKLLSQRLNVYPGDRVTLVSPAGAKLNAAVGGYVPRGG